MTLVVDASVAVQWVLDQSGSARASALREADSLIAPTLIAAEIGSAIWKAVRRRDVSRSDALIAIDAALLPIEALVPMEELRTRALDIAIDLQHPIYDCFYLALAERERVPLVCADGPLIEKAKKLKAIEVRAL
jgi:predicted nucleic acid-binding protein